MNKAIPSIKARSSSMDLVKIINGLTSLQKEDVIKMGFGLFLNDNFQINTTPTKLGLWVIENFDPDKCIIRMNGGRSILITSKMINEMIGIPMRIMVVTEVPTKTTEFPLIVDWRQTYKYPDERERRHKNHGLVYVFDGNDEENKERVQEVARFWRTTTADG
nr:ulp1 protease family, C-terminal catalytic domain-containing protein [Tanacetum cinerariifolium]